MRNYIVASWNDADQYDYSGEMLGGSRHAGRSQKVHFNADGSACVASYGDPEPTKKPKLSVADKILPQQRRLMTLTNQMAELVSDYKAGLYTLEEYSLLLDVLTVKRDRCHELLMKARSVKPVRNDEHTPQTPSHTFSPNAAQQPEFVQEKGQNSAKKDLQLFAFGSIILFIGFQLISHFV